jgi:hypothetical protein
MKTGWKLMARLGMSGPGYPHLLVDRHGWCLRLRPRSRTDEKYYSSLPPLLNGMVQQGVRRHLMAVGAPLDLQELCGQVRDALHTALGLRRQAMEKGGLEEHIPRLRPSEAARRHRSTFPSCLSIPADGNANGSPLTREAV